MQTNQIVLAPSGFVTLVDIATGVSTRMFGSLDCPLLLHIQELTLLIRVRSTISIHNTTSDNRSPFQWWVRLGESVKSIHRLMIVWGIIG